MFVSNINKLISDAGGVFEFANMIGSDKETVRKWSKGSSLPRSSELLKIVAIRPDISLDWLLLGKDSSQEFMCEWNEEAVEACKALKEIIESGDAVAKAAIMSNLLAFRESIKKNKRIDQLEKDVRELKKRRSAGSSVADPGGIIEKKAM